MIIVRLQLLLVPPQRPDAEYSNGDESSSSEFPTVLCGGILTELETHAFQISLKKKKARMPHTEGRQNHHLHHVFINSLINYNPNKAIRKQSFQSAILGGVHYSNCECSTSPNT